jgi:peroxiredoxin-like protein
MQALPHHYRVSAEGSTEDLVTLASAGLDNIASAAPAEFGGPGDQWSPETLLLAAVADCFVLSFRAVATASKFEWASLVCDTQGTLDRQDKITRFTEIHNKVTLQVAAGANEQRAQSLLEKAEKICLISNSLNAQVHLECHVVVGAG